MIYPQLIRQSSTPGATVEFVCSCLHASCAKVISYREWVDNQGYCELHAVELGKRW
jgi:hypothetical protein